MTRSPAHSAAHRASSTARSRIACGSAHILVQDHADDSRRRCVPGRGSERVTADDPVQFGPVKRAPRKASVWSYSAAIPYSHAFAAIRRDDGPVTSGAERSRRQDWQAWAVEQVEADANRSADTHLHVFPLPPDWGIRLYLKDESVHPTGSLKHRLARSLVLYGLCNNWIERGHHPGRGVLRLDGGERGVLRPAARAAVRGGDAGHARSSRSAP